MEARSNILQVVSSEPNYEDRYILFEYSLNVDPDDGPTLKYTAWTMTSFEKI